MDILSNYRITAATPREQELNAVAERVRVAYERLRTAEEAADLDGTTRSSWLIRVTKRFAAPSSLRVGRTPAVPCAPATH
jgi:hypothetical protein